MDAGKHDVSTDMWPKLIQIWGVYFAGGGSWPANAALYVVVHGSKDELTGAFNSLSASQGLLGPLWDKFGLQQSWGS